MGIGPESSAEMKLVSSTVRLFIVLYHDLWAKVKFDFAVVLFQPQTILGINKFLKMSTTLFIPAVHKYRLLAWCRHLHQVLASKSENCGEQEFS